MSAINYECEKTMTLIPAFVTAVGHRLPGMKGNGILHAKLKGDKIMYINQQDEP